MLRRHVVDRRQMRGSVNVVSALLAVSATSWRRVPRSRMLGSRNFRVRFSQFRVPSVPVNSEVGTRKFIEIQVNKKNGEI